MFLFGFLSCIENKTTEFLQTDRPEASLQPVNDSKLRGRTQNQQMNCCSACIRLTRTSSLKSNMHELNMTPRQNNSKANLLCVLLIVTRLPRQSETDERDREREREHCATCLVIHFKADASPTTALKQHTRHTPPLSFACLSPQNTSFHLNLFCLLTIIEA